METEALSVSQAAGLLAPEPPKDEQNTPETVETPPAPAQAEESAPQGEDGARPEEAPSAETKTEPDPAVPPIEPPSSMTAEEREKFKSLPREAQEFLARRERDQTNALRQKQDELANQRKALEAEAGRLKAAPAEPQIAAMWAQLATDFPDIKTEEDALRLSREDAARSHEFETRRNYIGKLQHQLNFARQQQLSAFTAEQEQKLVAADPETFGHAENGPKEIKAIRDFLNERGYTSDEIMSQAGLDARTVLLARDAMRYRDARKALDAAEAKLKALPPVVTPKSTPKADPRTEEVESLNRRLGQTGSVRDAAALLRAMRR